MKKLRTIIVAGLLVWIPIGLTIFVIKLLIDLLAQIYLLIPLALRPDNLLGIEIPGIGIIIAIIMVLLTGLIAANYFGNRIIKAWVYSLCFQTSKELGEVQDQSGEELVCVYIPTTPNPTSGYIVLVPQNEVKELEMSVEDALKMIISLGVVVPNPSALLDKE